jgi:FkbM family methyltransferase
MTITNFIKTTTGYWIHKLQTLPIGVDLFYDIQIRLKYGPLEIVFDVGANEGQTLKWIKHNKSESTVISFEPIKSTFDQLKENSLGYNNSLVENIAFGEEPEKIEVKLFRDLSVLNSLKPELMNHEPGALTEEINVVRIDAFCKQHTIDQIDLLKIDTEWYTLNILKGAGTLVDEGEIRFIYCEVGFQKTNKRNTNLEEMIAFLESKQYYFYALYQLGAHDWKSGNHLGNALFVHKSKFPS